MKIKKITQHKKRFLDLLLIADEEEHMIDRYLESGEVFILCDDDLKSISVVTASKDSYEIKNVATYPKYQKQGYGTQLVNYIIKYYKSKNVENVENIANIPNNESIPNSEALNKNFKTMYVGTGDCENIINFYEKIGFKKSHIIKNFFVDNYNEAIFENGKQLIDMIYLKIDL